MVSDWRSFTSLNLLCIATESCENVNGTSKSCGNGYSPEPTPGTGVGAGVAAKAIRSAPFETRFALLRERKQLSLQQTRDGDTETLRYP